MQVNLLLALAVSRRRPRVDRPHPWTATRRVVAVVELNPREGDTPPPALSRQVMLHRFRCQQTAGRNPVDLVSRGAISPQFQPRRCSLAKYPVQCGVRQGGISTFVPSSYTGVVSSEPALHDANAVIIRCPSTVSPPGHLKDGAPLIQSHGVSDHLDAWVMPQGRKTAWQHPAIGLHSIPDTHEGDRAWPTQCRFELRCSHVQNRVIRLRFRKLLPTLLPKGSLDTLLRSLVQARRVLDQMIVAAAHQPRHMKQSCQGANGERAAAEAKEEHAIIGLVHVHEKTVELGDVLDGSVAEHQFGIML